MTHWIDACYALARRGMTRPFSSTPVSTHDNPLRRIGRDMAKLEAKQVRAAKRPGVNLERREKNAVRARLGLKSGRAWRRWLKSAKRVDALVRSISTAPMQRAA